MNIKEIKQLMSLVKEYEVCEFEIEKEGERIMIKTVSGSAPAPYIHHIAEPHAIRESFRPEQESRSDDRKTEADSGLTSITSPIVGTFYAAPAPDAAPYVNSGSKIAVNDTVCIIEAMKVMNEIKAEITGTIEEILVKNGQAVEFGQVLFKVRT